MKNFAQQVFEHQFQVDLVKKLKRYRFRCNKPRIDTSLAEETIARWTLHFVPWNELAELGHLREN